MPLMTTQISQEDMSAHSPPALPQLLHFPGLLLGLMDHWSLKADKPEHKEICCIN